MPMQAQCSCAALPGQPAAIVRHALRTGHYYVSKHVQGIMVEEEESEESVTPKPAKKRKCLSLSRKKALSPTSRFSTMVGDDEVSSMSKGYVPPNTQKNTDWAVKNFGTWRVYFYFCLFHHLLTFIIHLSLKINIKMGGASEGAVYA